MNQTFTITAQSSLTLPLGVLYSSFGEKQGFFTPDRPPGTAELHSAPERYESGLQVRAPRGMPSIRSCLSSSFGGKTLFRSDGWGDRAGLAKLAADEDIGAPRGQPSMRSILSSSFGWMGNMGGMRRDRTCGTHLKCGFVHFVWLESWFQSTNYQLSRLFTSFGENGCASTFQWRTWAIRLTLGASWKRSDHLVELHTPPETTEFLRLRQCFSVRFRTLTNRLMDGRVAPFFHPLPCAPSNRLRRAISPTASPLPRPHAF